jgi:hypothetical protein
MTSTAAAVKKNRGSVELVSTVANTVFPASWYAEHLGEAA